MTYLAKTHYSGFKQLRQIVALAIVGALIVSSCSQKESPPQSELASSVTSTKAVLSPLTADSSFGWAKAGEAGISWGIPATWTVGPKMPMRAGTYFAGASGGDSDPAECRVNFFGAGQGGSVDDNISRWVGQFELEGQQGKNPAPLVEKIEINRIPVAVVELSGVYLSKARPMAREFTRKPGFKMFATIVSAPEGTVFFKMTGPAKTMEANRDNFRMMLGTIASGS